MILLDETKSGSNKIISLFNINELNQLQMETLSVFTTYSFVQGPLSQTSSLLKRFEKDTGVCLARMICKNILIITFIIIFN